MTSVEQVEAVRARLAEMGDRLGRGMVARQEEDDHLLLRLVDHAENVLDTHNDSPRWAGYCEYDGFSWPCLEVMAVVKAWLP